MIVNGKEISLEDLRVETLDELVAHYGLKVQTVAVEMNGTIPSRDTWSRIVLKEDDRVEIIRFVGGG